MGVVTGVGMLVFEAVTFHDVVPFRFKVLNVWRALEGSAAPEAGVEKAEMPRTNRTGCRDAMVVFYREVGESKRTRAKVC